MLNLLQTLRDYDRHMLTIIANRWDVDLTAEDFREAAKELAEAMLDPALAEHEWSRLSEQERGAMQMLLAALEHKMPAVQFERLYGEIRQMGEERRQREKPYLEPTGFAETIFYRGLISRGFDEAKTGAQVFVYVPLDLAKVLPIHQTGFDLTEDIDDDFPDDDDAGGFLGEATLTDLAIEAPPAKWDANAFLVDDMTTLLAYLQVNKVTLKKGNFAEQDARTLFENFIGLPSPTRLSMMLNLALDLELVESDGAEIVPIPSRAKIWLEAPRIQQMQSLVEAWDNSFRFNELWYVPSLVPDETGWENDPTLLRETLHTFFEMLPAKEWVDLHQFIGAIKSAEPDFQRPGGDYDSWYIRSSDSGEYLNGFENWDTIEGATIQLTLIGPMYWLGLINLGKPDVSAKIINAHAFQMTAFGRAWAQIAPWPKVPPRKENMLAENNGEISASRHVSRYDRFQLARFAEWVTAEGETYTYRLTTNSLKGAYRQGIEPRHVDAFLRRILGELPPQILNVLGNQAPAATRQSETLSIGHMIVLETNSPRQLDDLWNDPALRRFFGRRLGDMAVAVREDKVDELLAILDQLGIFVDE